MNSPPSKSPGPNPGNGENQRNPENNQPGRIVLIGPRAAGKSKASRNLHRVLGFPAMSTDQLAIYESMGRSIPEIIQQNGGDWQVFRELEYQILSKLAPVAPLILDCGGGILVDLDGAGREIFSERKANLLRQNSLIIYLRADTDRIWQKIQNDPSRPSLSDTHSFQDLMQRRAPWYEKMAHHTLDTTDMKGRLIAWEICQILRARGYSFKKPPEKLLKK